MKKQNSQARWMVLTGTIIGLAVISLLFGLAWPPLIQAGPTLPPRDPATTTPAPKDKDKDDNKPVGAYIELQIQTTQAGLWLAVQWQDSAGGWHDVAGWRGPLAEGNRQWWVAAKDFGTGPFRWIVTEGSGGRLVGGSQTFNLPNQANETLRVTVSLTP
jgi:hypothetical protein